MSPKSNLSPRVEALAQKHFKYLDLFERYASDLRKDLTQGKEAYDRTIREWDHILKPGEKPSFAHQDPMALQRTMKDICSMEPKSLDDRVKIMCAAHAMTNSIILHDMRDLTEHEQGQVNIRVTQLVQQTLPPRDTKSTFASSPFRPALQKPQYPLITTTPQVVTGQKYALQLLNDVITYEIRGVVLDSDNNRRYQIKYNEEGENVYEEEIGSEDMLDMLSSSVLLDL
ncbi:hypothetical protein M378DRAFT_26197 [Amanita muscaria Koide BX008]|uniref:Uncharacterized protein n=1 Tax=Amanita muscaria (strain Koide BX008) TaxID=946122 RepID=A0A0C2WHZ6_AMAMK|nr:hypothetical protein M378DRAFT_26197 [Amanita muscaria Koide BX008]